MLSGLEKAVIPVARIDIAKWTPLETFSQRNPFVQFPPFQFYGFFIDSMRFRTFSLLER